MILRHLKIILLKIQAFVDLFILFCHTSSMKLQKLKTDEHIFVKYELL